MMQHLHLANRPVLVCMHIYEENKMSPKLRSGSHILLGYDISIGYQYLAHVSLISRSLFDMPTTMKELAPFKSNSCAGSYVIIECEIDMLERLRDAYRCFGL
jgi:hypothetical protein